MSDLPVVAFVAGLVGLFLGGELLVRGASRLALRMRISALVVGLTVVAIGTSAPELVVSLVASAEGKPDIAVGNVVGSNIFNILLILGVCALVRPLVVSRELVWREIPVMIGASVVLLFFGLDGRLRLVESLALLVGLVAFTFTTIVAGKREAAAPAGSGEPPPATGARAWALDAAMIAAGLVALVAGARWLVGASVFFARALGVDETVIGLTIVAAGTSLPEVATSIVATIRGQRDIAVGNVIGSNIFNILGILGVSGLLAGELRINPAIEAFDLPVMTAVALAALPLMARRHLLARWEGALFLGYYAAYVVYLLLSSKQHAALSGFSTVMLDFVAPLTLLTILVLAARERWRRPARGVA